MGYQVRALPFKRRSWKIQYETRAGGRKTTDIKEEQYLSLGFFLNMTLEEARTRCKELNSQLLSISIQNKRISIDNRIKEEEIKLNSFLPTFLIKEFEELYIEKNNKKSDVHWRTTKRVIVEVALDPSDWSFHKEKFYKLFQTKCYSYDYTQKIIHMLNKYGKFVAYKQKSFFEPIPSPRSRDKEKLVDIHSEEKGSTVSEAITPRLLESKKSSLRTDHYNWLHLSVWLGLRPAEVDLLLKEPGKSTWTISVCQNNTVVCLYQSKLTGVPKDKRYKYIPLKYQEQIDCTPIILSGQFRRPLNKTLKLTFGGQYTCYGGRKGFTNLMLEKGNSLEAIASWMGHSSIERTWRSYKDRNKVLL